MNKKLEQYIKDAQKTAGPCIEKGKVGAILYTALGLVGETEELYQLFEKGSPQKTDAAVDEIGDIFWYTSILCDLYEIDHDIIFNFDNTHIVKDHSTQKITFDMIRIGCNIAGKAKKVHLDSDPDRAMSLTKEYIQSYLVELHIKIAKLLIKIGRTPYECMDVNTEKLFNRLKNSTIVWREGNHNKDHIK